MEVAVSANTISIPPKCACCGERPDRDVPVSASRTTGVRVVRTATSTFSFPYCNQCLAHIEANPYPVGCVAIFGVILTLGILVIFLQRWRAKADAMRKPTCSDTGPGVRYVGWHGSTRVFEFVSPTYAAVFALANAKKLVNVSMPLRNAIEALATNAAARALEPGPSAPRVSRAPAPPVADRNPDDEAFVDAIAKLEKASGPASRRAIVEKALASLSTNYMKERFLVEASLLRSTRFWRRSIA